MRGGFENSAKHVVRAFGGLLAFEGNSLFFREFLFALVLVMETEGFVMKDEFAEQT